MKIRWRKPRNFGLKRKALVIFLLFVILPTIGVGVIVQYKYNKVLREQFISSTRRNLDNVTSQLGEQTKMVEDIADYFILSPDMRNFLRSYPPLGNEQKAVYKRNIEDFLTFQLMSKSYIRSIVISGFNGNSIEMGEPFSGDEGVWEREAVARKGGIYWTEGYPLKSSWNGQVRVLSMIRILNSFSEITKPLGMLTIRLDEASIAAQLEKGVLAADYGSVFMVGGAGDLILESVNRLPGGYVPGPSQMHALTTGTNKLAAYTVAGKRYLTMYNQIENSEWKVVVMISEAKMAEEFRGVKIVMLIILTAILVLALTALFGFHYTIIRPILRLKIETGRVAGGDFSARVPIDSQDEIAELNSKFNEMVMTIQQLIEHKYKLELRERESELRLMQNQMDPHFLYNTLDMIRWTARLEQAEQSSQLIEMLSRFFRASVNNGSYQTTLGKEMEFVQAYLYLQQYRLGDKLSYSLHLEPGIEDAVTLKATIQPLVENALKHAWDRSRPVNRIEVKAYTAGDEIRIEVTDNGKGMTADRARVVAAALKPGPSERIAGHGGALHNIHERLSIFFGQAFGLKIIYTSDEGTGIRITLPLQRAEGEGGEDHEQ
ncbi:cache domain-containing sensor histidine kinase [Paenibacillus sonchi]|uniref:cache domain-containing sensor histidine kinase n=1 Tax=Paenibacillus sonchi TaxID=373687 RepID=UPI001E308BA6|nr:sensor histidine kinase [Paenibacillus sonchi]MCE3199787.1 sensor histidine kinase [Paenibacillus sonchi]